MTIDGGLKWWLKFLGSKWVGEVVGLNGLAKSKD